MQLDVKDLLVISYFISLFPLVVCGQKLSSVRIGVTGLFSGGSV